VTRGRAVARPDPTSGAQADPSCPPRISVLLPVHNGGDYIESALRSVMAQTFRDLEILVVDDASTDATPAILARLAAEDPRIRILRPETNLRLPRALNFGLEHARGEYVARMDADDLCEPDRFALQARFLDTHPEIVLVGCSERTIDPDGNKIKDQVRAQSPEQTRWLLRIGMAFRHPAFLFRRREMTLRYDPACTLSEDYDILVRLTETSKVACLPDLLLRYREHPGALSAQKAADMPRQARMLAEKVQRADLPEDVFLALEPFRDAYYDRRPLDTAGQKAVFDGLIGMMAFDHTRMPGHRRWVARQTAQLAAHAMMRGGVGARGNLAAFLRHAPGLLPAVGWRYLENQGRLPARLRSDRLAMT